MSNACIVANVAGSVKPGPLPAWTPSPAAGAPALPGGALLRSPSRDRHIGLKSDHFNPRKSTHRYRSRLRSWLPGEWHVQNAARCSQRLALANTIDLQAGYLLTRWGVSTTLNVFERLIAQSGTGQRGDVDLPLPVVCASSRSVAPALSHAGLVPASLRSRSTRHSFPTAPGQRARRRTEDAGWAA